MINRLYTEYKNLINVIFMVIGFAFFISLFFTFDLDFASLLEKVSYKTLLIAFIFGFLQSLGLWFYFNQVCDKNNLFPTRKNSIKAFFYSQITKYIPGKIWGIVYQFTYLRSSKKIRHLITINIVFSFYYLSIIAIVALSIYSAFQNSLLLISAIIIFSLITSYILTHNIVNLGVNFFQKNPSKHLSVQIEPSLLFILTSCTCFSLFFSHILYIKSFFVIDFWESSHLFAFFSLAWIGGFLAVFFPSGVGVREAIFIYFGQFLSNFSLEFLASIAVLLRALQITQELLNLSIAILWCKYFDKS